MNKLFLSSLICIFSIFSGIGAAIAGTYTPILPESYAVYNNSSFEVLVNQEGLTEGLMQCEGEHLNSCIAQLEQHHKLLPGTSLSMALSSRAEKTNYIGNILGTVNVVGDEETKGSFQMAVSAFPGRVVVGSISSGFDSAASSTAENKISPITVSIVKTTKNWNNTPNGEYVSKTIVVINDNFIG